MSDQKNPAEPEGPDTQSGTQAGAQNETDGAAEAGGSAVKLDSFDGEAQQKAQADAASAASGAAADQGGSAEAEVEAMESDAASSPMDAAALAARVEQLEAELSAKSDQHLRAVAEVQNIRRRAERDRRDAEQFGGQKLARDILPVFDNLDEALRQASDALKENEAGFFNGVELTRKVLLDGLAKSNITLINPEIGEKFDPNRHQAMFEAPAPGAQPGSIIQVMQCGFMIAERLLRPAMVGVASAASAQAGPGPADEKPGDKTQEGSGESKSTGA